jgi:hypothetical protein
MCSSVSAASASLTFARSNLTPPGSSWRFSCKDRNTQERWRILQEDEQWDRSSTRTLTLRLRVQCQPLGTARHPRSTPSLASSLRRCSPASADGRQRTASTRPRDTGGCEGDSKEKRVNSCQGLAPDRDGFCDCHRNHQPRSATIASGRWCHPLGACCHQRQRDVWVSSSCRHWDVPNASIATDGQSYKGQNLGSVNGQCIAFAFFNMGSSGHVSCRAG